MDASSEEWERFLPQSGEDIHSEFASAFAGQAVCVAGAGGYIGSALVRALAPTRLRSLILLDSSEYGLFQIQRKMETTYSDVCCQSVLGSVDDARLLDDVFSRFRPEIVFHAAAFKHVGLLEQNAFAAIQNNVLGSYTLTKAAQRNGVSKMVLISTDKAVHPHSVMGVSKRLAELITLSFSRPALRANAIRLGNVIGSTGSVVPLFLDQIARDQPISVTHKDASRYFLSTHEAVQAILASGIASCEGRVFLPIFREPVRIVELANFLASVNVKTGNGIRPLSFTGLRPGEKLTEDLAGENEVRAGTMDGPLTVYDTRRLSIEECDEAVERLSTCVAKRDAPGLLRALCSLVPEYVPSKLMQEGGDLARVKIEAKDSGSNNLQG